MKFVNVIIKNKTQLELLEDANKGDIIDLEKVMDVDASSIEELIKNKKDKVYEEKLAQVKAEQEKIHNSEIEHLKSENETLRKAELLKLNGEIDKLKVQLDNNKKLFESDLANKEKDIEIKYKDEISELKNQISELENNIKKQDEITNLKVNESKEKTINELTEKFNAEKEDLKNIINEKVDMINLLQRQKAALNVKQTGEDLESWCDNEVKSYMQNGFDNCTWIKDNVSVKDEGETKGSKADYIFTVYADDKKDAKEKILSICLDMKDENPDSKTKQSNEKYYPQLDKNRVKKNCEYSVLVSNLEMDKPNYIPIYKVAGYENMYVVRPGYLMTFLNMMVSLSKRYVSYVLEEKKEQLALLSKLELIEKFNTLKKSLLDKPLLDLENKIEAIAKDTKKIRDAADSIEKEIDWIGSKFIYNMRSKLDDFDIKISKAYKKACIE